MRVFAHIAPAIKVNEARHTCDDRHHNNGHGINADRPVGLELTNVNPRHAPRNVRACMFRALDDSVRLVMMAAKTRDIGKELIQRQNTGKADRRCGHHHRAAITDKFLEKTCDQSCEARTENNKLNELVV